MRYATVIGSSTRNYFLLGGIVLPFIGLNLYLMSEGIYLLNLLPLVILFSWIAFTSLDTLLLVTVFFTPVSVQLSLFIKGLDMDLSLPTEPFLILIMVLYLLKMILEKGPDRRLWRHPVSIAVFIYLAWMLLTALTSTMPGVSLKYFVARLWFIIAFYFLASQVFLRGKNIEKYIRAYIIPFILVIGYALYQHSQQGLVNQMASHSAVHPFYNDHTAYGSALAMLLPFLFSTAIFGGVRPGRRVWVVLLLLLFSFATVFSYSRATWLSLLFALVVFILVKMRIRLMSLSLIVLLAGIYIYLFRTEIIMKMEENKQTSSKEFTEHIQSMANITSDASNAERINRWKSAIRMYRERPLTGWGPGTYQFKYAPFQRSREKTYISTDFGDQGTAHSEYFGPLSESGLPGLLSVLLLVLTAVYTGLRTYRRLPPGRMKMITMSVFLGLVTYFTHGMLNNFLHSDKASALVWGFIAILVAIDLQSGGKKELKVNGIEPR